MHCDCEICKLNIRVSLPDHLLQAVLSGEVVIFAGAGISTESRRVLKFTFYDEIASEIGDSEDSLQFPELMQRFSSRPDGRINLLRKIRDRFEHIDSFPELNWSASVFHRAMGSIFPITEVVTTNWDTYFEQYCHATPFVSDSDIPFWAGAKRKVLKIHGSVANLGSIVATTADYEKCAEGLNTGLVGSLLKTLLATRTFVFVGYSLRDPDFNQIYEFVRKQLAAFSRQAYVVTPFESDIDAFEAAGFIALKTDGAFFLHQLKRRLIEMDVLVDDVVFEWAADLREKVSVEHSRLHKTFNLTNLPEVIYAASYQDGLGHALERALRLRGSGEYSHRCRLQNLIHLYIEKQKKKRADKKYEDVAYIEGYISGLFFILISNREGKPHEPPLYFAFGVNEDLYSVAKFARLFKGGQIPHASARRRALQWIRKLKDPRGIEFHHPPWL